MVIIMDNVLYKIVRPILLLTIKMYRPTIIGKENIPKSGRILLAGNHTNNLDCFLVGASTKREVHFLAKDSLIKGLKKPVMMGLGIIPVNRNIKDTKAKNNAIEALNNDLLVCIFPEGTINKSKEIILPFKYGAVSIANKSNTKIVPFSITGKYKLFKKNIKIVFDKPYEVGSDLSKENEILMNKVKDLIINNKGDLNV